MKWFGWLIFHEQQTSNSFVYARKRLQTAFEKQGCLIQCLPSTQFFYTMNDSKTELENRYGKVDFVLFWDKNIALAEFLFNLGIPCFNSPSTIACCDDKVSTAQFLIKHHFPTPKTLVYPFYYEATMNSSFLIYAEKELHYPYIIKEAQGSFGEQVYWIASMEEAKRCLQHHGVKKYLFQELITTSVGKDLRVYVVGETVVASAVRLAKEGEWRSNIELGGVMQTYALSDSQKMLAVSIVKSMGLTFAGIDFLFAKENSLSVCEVNSNALFKALEEISGTDIAGAIAKEVCKRVNSLHNPVEKA